MYFAKNLEQFLCFTVVSVQVSVTSSGLLYFLSTHSAELTEQCIVILTLFNFLIQKRQQNSLLATERDVENL